MYTSEICFLHMYIKFNVKFLTVLIQTSSSYKLDTNVIFFTRALIGRCRFMPLFYRLPFSSLNKKAAEPKVILEGMHHYKFV